MTINYSIVLSNPHCNGGMHSEIKGCCSEEEPCIKGQGDCDKASECIGNLVCGSNNCDPSKFPSGGTDCCEEGT